MEIEPNILKFPNLKHKISLFLELFPSPQK